MPRGIETETQRERARARERERKREGEGEGERGREREREGERGRERCCLRSAVNIFHCVGRYGWLSVSLGPLKALGAC